MLASLSRRALSRHKETKAYLNDIVGHTIGRQHSRQIASSSTETVVVDVLDGKEAEHSRSLKGTLDVLDELVVPVRLDVQARCSNVGWLGEIPEAMASNLHDAAAAETYTKNLHGTAEVATSRWVQNETGLQEPQKKWQRKVEQEWEQESQPPAHVLLGVGGRHTHEASNVDEQIEPQHRSLGRRLGIFNHSFALFGRDHHWHSRRHLIQKQRGYIGLEHGYSMASATLGGKGRTERDEADQLTGANSQNVQREQVRSHGASVLQE